MPPSADGGVGESAVGRLAAVLAEHVVDKKGDAGDPFTESCHAASLAASEAAVTATAKRVVSIGAALPSQRLGQSSDGG